MANIKNHLNNIKNALFGQEVRGSIHDGIDAINKEVESTTSRQVDLEKTFDQLVINAGNSNAEIVDARVGENGKSYAKLGDRLDEVDSQLEHIDNKLSKRKFNPFFCTSSYWSEVLDNDGNYMSAEVSKVERDIDVWKNHNVDGVTIVIHIGLNTSTNKLFIGADLDLYIDYINKCIDNGLPIYAIKVHKQKMSQPQIEGVADFNEQWLELLKQIANKFSPFTERFFCFNEFKYMYAESKNIEFVKNCLQEVKALGYKVGISSQGSEETYVLDEGIKEIVDIFGINHYRYISSKLDKTTYEDSFKNWNNSAVLKTLNYLKRNYKDKEVVLSETGVQDYWEALAKPEYYSWANPTSANGKAQAIYLYGLLNTTNVDFIDGVCWWYNFAYKDGYTSEMLQEYLGGVVSE